MKQRIAHAFKTLLSDQDYDEVTVQGIANAAQISRKTFYYHFSHKVDLLAYIFRSDFAQRLENTFVADVLISNENKDEDKYAEFPYFVEDPFKPDDQSDFFLEFSQYIGETAMYYKKLARGEDWTYFENYLEVIYTPLMTQTIEEYYQENGVEAPADDVHYLAAYYTYSTVLWLFHRYTMKHQKYTSATKHHLANLFYENITNTVNIQTDRIKKGR